MPRCKAHGLVVQRDGFCALCLASESAHKRRRWVPWALAVTAMLALAVSLSWRFERPTSSLSSTGVDATATRSNTDDAANSSAHAVGHERVQVRQMATLPVPATSSPSSSVAAIAADTDDPADFELKPASETPVGDPRVAPISPSELRYRRR